MARLVVLAVSGLMLVSCGPAASASPPTSPVAASSGSPSPQPSSSATRGSPSATAATTAAAHRLFDCHAASEPFACPLSPGLHVAEIHDRFSMEIKDPGWQEARVNPEDLSDEDPTLLINRIADPNERLIIDTGPTGESVSDTQLLPDLSSLQVGSPTAVTIGGTTGFRVDLAPTKSMELSVPLMPGVGYQLEPGTTYRLIVTQLPMGEESGIKVILMSAPTSAWSTYLPLADAVVQTLKFG